MEGKEADQGSELPTMKHLAAPTGDQFPGRQYTSLRKPGAFPGGCKAGWKKFFSPEQAAHAD